jgi:hypothetical protein
MPCMSATVVFSTEISSLMDFKEVFDSEILIKGKEVEKYDRLFPKRTSNAKTGKSLKSLPK